MNKLRFWKRNSNDSPESDVGVIKKFNVQPRTDIGVRGLPSNPDIAIRIAAMRRRRESLVSELQIAESSTDDDNRWQAEIRLIDQALGEIAGDLSRIGSDPESPGQVLPATPVADITVETEPTISVQFRIGDETFRYSEPIDWAERGTQIARSDLVRDDGDPACLVPEGPDIEVGRLVAHLEQTLFVFASDVRDRGLAGEATPIATLADLARPSETFGGWLDWAGNSRIETEWNAARAQLHEQRGRLEAERAELSDEEARVAENLPFVRRRLAELDKEMDALLNPDSGT